jgi:hypothetical protein
MLTDEQIIDIRKQASGGRFGKPGTAPWADTLKFARAVESEVIEAMATRIKAVDDAAADRDYMLDSNDCISVLRGTWIEPETISEGTV